MLRNFKYSVMKKVVFCLLICFSAWGWAQDSLETKAARSELKLNAFNLIGFKFLDITYENILTPQSSAGLAVLVNINEQEDFYDYRTFSITPFVRQFFSKGYGSGFFVEVFGMFNQGKTWPYNDFTFEQEEETYSDFALGVSVGGKFINSKGLVAEVYAGLGRNFLNTEVSPEVVGRAGISLGFRF